MKKFISTIAMLLMVCMLAGMLVACGDDTSGSEVKPTQPEVLGEMTDFLIAEKVGVVHKDGFMTAPGGLYYKENDMYGVISSEGLHDTGAIYTNCENVGQYFQVSQKTISGKTDYANLNSMGLIDGKGRELIPMEYADLRVMNERYVQAKKVTGVLADSEGAVGSIYINSESVYYAGTWCVIDLETGKTVPGVTGTEDDYPFANGNYITYNDGSSYKKVDYNGNPLPEGADLFDDGSYSVESKIGEVFDTDGNKLFGYDLTGYIPSLVQGDYYLARMYVDGVSKYAVMDKAGKIVSAEFTGNVELHGNLVECEDGLYNFEGERIYEGADLYVIQDKMFNNNWIIKQDDVYTMIDIEGNVYYSVEDNDEYSVFTSDFVVQKKDEAGDYYYYNQKDHEYNIQGYSFAPWLVKSSAANYRYDLVDTMTGETLLEGYENYSYNAYNAFAYYVYAKYEGGAEVYLIVPDSQFVDVEQKKEDLYNDMAAAFAEEGINATIDRETGVIALDSGVLFGGDSAVLTDDGKAFLDRFIKVYTQIAFSDKYVNFINKTMIEGHTAPVAGSSYALDLPLSEERANNVLQYCLEADTGIDPTVLANSFEAVGYANSQPVYGADGEVDMAASRRVSFRFLVAVEFD